MQVLRPKGMNATIAGAASVSTSSSPVSAVEVLTLAGLISNRLGGSVLYVLRDGGHGKDWTRRSFTFGC